MSLCKFCDLYLDFVEYIFAVAHKIHLVHGKDKVANTHQPANAGVSTRLYENALRCIYENHCEVGKRCAHGHVARVFFMPRSVSNDKAAVIRREIAVRDIDGNALLAFGHQAVQQKGIVNFSAAATDFTVELQSFFLVGVEQLGIVKDMPDERRLSIVHTAACNKLQQTFH